MSVREILTTRLGWSDSDAQKFAANVSHFYDNRIRHGKAPKDAQGIAIYDESDIDGLIDAARNIKSGRASDNAYDKPTRFAGSTAEDMGF